MFIGAFNKKTAFCDRTWAEETLGLKYPFDPTFFDAVAKRIVNILGEKETYTVQDAYRYFHVFYHAYQIDYRQYYNYCHTDAAKLIDLFEATISDDSEIEVLAESSGKFFSYLSDGKFTDEKALTLVIDSLTLRALSKAASNDNLILVIGSFDGERINSMKVLLSPNDPEIEYALEFFRLHS